MEPFSWMTGNKQQRQSPFSWMSQRRAQDAQASLRAQQPQPAPPPPSLGLMDRVAQFTPGSGLAQGIGTAIGSGTERRAQQQGADTRQRQADELLRQIRDPNTTDAQRQQLNSLLQNLISEGGEQMQRFTQESDDRMGSGAQRQVLASGAELGLLAATGGAGRLAGLSRTRQGVQTGRRASSTQQFTRMRDMSRGQVGRAAGVLGTEGAAMGGAGYLARADDPNLRDGLLATAGGAGFGAAIPVAGQQIGRAMGRRQATQAQSGTLKIADKARNITPQTANGKAAQRVLDATNTADYKGGLTDNMSSFFRALSGAMEETGGGRFIHNYYEKIIGGIANRDALQKMFTRNLNANLGLSNRVKRKIGADVGEILRRAPDEQVNSLTAQQLAQKYGKSVEVARAAKTSRQHFRETLETSNAARVNRGEEAIPDVDQYMPQWLRKRGADRAGAGRGYGVDGEAFNPFAQERVPGMTEAMRRMSNRDITGNSAKQLARKFDIPEDLAKKIKQVELNPFNNLDQYHRYAANEVELTPVIQNLNRMADDIAESNPAGAQWLRDYVRNNISKTRAPDLDKALGITGGNMRQRFLQRLSLARSLSGLVGNPGWTIFTQPQTLFVAGGKFGKLNLAKGLMDYATDPSLRREIKNLEIYRLKRSGSVGATAGGQLDRVADSVLKTRREFANDIMTIGSNFIEAQLDAISAATARRAAMGYVKKGKMTQEGVRNFMNFGIESTQSVYAAEMRSQLLSNLSVRAAFPFQTYSNEMFRHVRNLSTGKSAGFRLTASQRAVQATNMVFMMLVGNELQKQFTGRQLTTPGSVTPFVGGLVDRGIDEVTTRTGLPDTDFSFDDSVSITAFEGDFKQLYRGIEKYIEDGDERQLRRAMVRWGTGLSGLGGAAGINRLIDTADAWNKEYLRYGEQEVPFGRTARNVVQGSVTGVWTTPDAKEFLSQQNEMFEMRTGLLEQISRSTTGDLSEKMREAGGLSEARTIAREHNRRIQELKRDVENSNLSDDRKKTLIEALEREEASEEDFALRRRLKLDD